MPTTEPGTLSLLPQLMLLEDREEPVSSSTAPSRLQKSLVFFFMGQTDRGLLAQNVFLNTKIAATVSPMPHAFLYLTLPLTPPPRSGICFLTPQI